MGKKRKGIRPVFWFFGIPGTGKSTLAMSLFSHIRFKRGVFDTAFVDGNYQRACDNNWDFSPEGRIKNINNIRAIAKHFSENGVVTIISAITPFQEMRDKNRQELKDYHEIYVSTSCDTRFSRSTGDSLIKQALRGEVQNFTGISGRFDEPTDSHLVINNDRPLEQVEAELLAYADTVLNTVFGSSS